MKNIVVGHRKVDENDVEMKQKMNLKGVTMPI